MVAVVWVQIPQLYMRTVNFSSRLVTSDTCDLSFAKHLVGAEGVESKASGALLLGFEL